MGASSSLSRSPLIEGLPASLAITAGVSSQLGFVSASLADGNPVADDTLVLTLKVASGNVAASSADADVSVGGTATARTLTGKASALAAFLARGDVSYTGSAVTLAVELASESQPSHVASTTVSLTAPTQTSTAAAQLTVPTSVNTTPGALVAIPFSGSSVTSSDNVQLTFEASGFATLGWQASAVVTAASSSAVSLSGSASAVSEYLAGGGVKLGSTGTGSVNVTLVSGGVTTVRSIAVSLQTATGAARVMPAVVTPRTFNVGATGGQLVFPSSAVTGTGSPCDSASQRATPSGFSAR
jgi:hypothetical protein